MGRPTVYASLDIGTTSIKVVVAEYVNDKMNIIGVGNEPSEGVSRGVIVDIDKTVTAIKRAVEQAERKSNCQISNVIVGVPANQVHIDPCYGVVAVSGEDGKITDYDVEQVLKAAQIKAVSQEREIISIVPEEFIIDGYGDIHDPRNMLGVRLELYANMATGAKTIIHNIKRSVMEAGLNIADLVVAPLAMGATALSKSERQFGTILLDLGGGQSSASVIHEQELKFFTTDLEGGEYVTKDISTVLNTTMENAERLKLEYGFASSKNTSEEEMVPVDVIGKKEPVPVDEHYLSEIIEARCVQILETLKRSLDQVEAFALPGGVVITGGAAALPRMEELAQEIFNTDVRFYTPDYVGLRNPIFTTAIGLIQYTHELEDVYRITKGNAYDNSSRERYDESAYRRPVTRPEPQVEKTTEAKTAQTTTVKPTAKTTQPKKDQQAKDDSRGQGSFSERISNFFKDIFN